MQAHPPTILTLTARTGASPPTTGRRWRKTAMPGGAAAYHTWHSELPWLAHAALCCLCCPKQLAFGVPAANMQAPSVCLRMRLFVKCCLIVVPQVFPCVPHRPHPGILPYLGDSRGLLLRHPGTLPPLHPPLTSGKSRCRIAQGGPRALQTLLSAPFKPQAVCYCTLNAACLPACLPACFFLSCFFCRSWSPTASGTLIACVSPGSQTSCCRMCLVPSWRLKLLPGTCRSRLAGATGSDRPTPGVTLLMLLLPCCGDLQLLLCPAPG
jgi:hypothetical protein